MAAAACLTGFAISVKSSSVQTNAAPYMYVFLKKKRIN
jgi:hypothetical protein